MNTDVALNYKALLIEIENKIKEIKNIGFNVSKLNEELDSIKLNNNNNVKESKKKNFDGFLTFDYTNAINNLNKLQIKLDEYNIYIKIYYYTKYLEELDITKDNINEIISEIKVLLKGIRNSSIMDYEDEKHLVEPFYKMIFEVFYKEIFYYQKSDLLEYCKLDSVDSSFIAKIVEDYLKEFDLFNYKDIKLNYFNIKKSGNLSDILDLEFIKSIVFRDEKEKLEEDIKVRYGEIVSEVNESNKNIETILNRHYSIKQNLEKSQFDYSKSIKNLIKSIVSFSISLSIPIGVFFGSLPLTRKDADAEIYSYQTKTSSYSTLNDDIEISNQREIIKKDDLQENTAYLIKYEVLSDKEVKKQLRNNSSYSDYDELEAKYKLRNTLKYDLSFLGYDDIEQYIKYIKADGELPKPVEDTVDISAEKDNYNNLVDYYEIVYKLVDLESKNYEGYNSSYVFYSSMFYAACSVFFVLFFRWSHCSFLPRDIRKYLDYKGELKYNKNKLNGNFNALLDEIGQNDELRKVFNIEMAKHKNLFIEAGLVLPDEVISEEEKVKLLSKGNIKK